ncbi:MAG: 1-deoxy-D-xylulose-5-phosphate reductoisomerase [Pseudohongiellaceae bacterium]|jgi:1-deoxy-D-xylulose-5-phosphate reductoisomerase
MSNRPRRLCILGSTGSIGQSTLAVVDVNPEFEVTALSGHRNIDLLLQQCLKYHPKIAVVSRSEDAKNLAQSLRSAGSKVEVLWGADALSSAASDDSVDMVMAAIVGAAGLESTLAAARAGKTLLLANKESLVMSGDLLFREIKASGATLIPIDSEHNAIFQCLPQNLAGQSAETTKYVSKIALTASGGPFLDRPLNEFGDITPAQACKHPTWSMGRKISVDSATMMNKGLEFIEASLLFGLTPHQIEVLIHPQSTVHSLVYYKDGSVLAQLGSADMRIPIAYGMAYPGRIESGAASLDLIAAGSLDFFEPDYERFPCLKLGIDAALQGGTTPTLLNAANEIAVEAFLAGQIKFIEIAELNEQVLSKIPCEPASSLAIIRTADLLARNITKELILKKN